MIIQGLTIYKEYIAKFQINVCPEHFAHEPILFVHYFEYSTLYLHYIKIYKKSINYFTSFFKGIYQNQPFPNFKHVYFNFVWIKFQILIA